MTDDPKRLDLADGQVHAWIEDDSSIHLKALSSFGDPVELTEGEASDLAARLLNFVGQLSGPDSPVQIVLSRDEALVLFELLSRFGDVDKVEIEHQAEQRALWNLCCLLERSLVEPLLPDYRDRLDASRRRLRDDVE